MRHKLVALVMLGLIPILAGCLQYNIGYGVAKPDFTTQNAMFTIYGGNSQFISDAWTACNTPLGPDWSCYQTGVLQTTNDVIGQDALKDCNPVRACGPGADESAALNGRIFTNPGGYPGSNTAWQNRCLGFQVGLHISLGGDISGPSLFVNGTDFVYGTWTWDRPNVWGCKAKQ